MMSDGIQQVALKKHVSASGQVQWVAQEDAHRNDRNEIHDLLVCAWCGKNPILYSRKSLMKCLRGKNNRKLPHCGCQFASSRKEEIIKDYKSDMTIKEMVAKYDISHETIIRLMRAAGIARKPPRQYTKEATDYQIISRLLLLSDTSKVASILGITKARVQKAVKAYMDGPQV